MADSNSDFEHYKCSDEAFKKWLLSDYINELDYFYYKSILEYIIECEMKVYEYDRSKKFNDFFLDERAENVYRRLEIINQFEQWVKDYAKFKNEEQIDLVEWVKNFKD